MAKTIDIHSAFKNSKHTKADPLEVCLDPAELAYAYGEAVTEELKQGLADGEAGAASPSTIARRARSGITSTKALYATGDLARSLKTEKNSGGAATTSAVSISDRASKLLQEFVATTASSPDVRKKAEKAAEKVLLPRRK